MIMDSVGNTVYLNVLNLLVTFPAPILLALMLNEVRCSIFKRVIQTVSYLPYFLSWISVVGLVQTILGLYGPVNDLLALFGGSNFERILFLGQQKYFIPTYLILNLWKGTGWGTVIYLAAISGIDMQLYEAATIDGANKLQQIWHITLPAIRQTAILLLIMSIGNFLNTGMEQFYVFQNAMNKEHIEVLDLYVYNLGIGTSNNIPFATAVGIMKSGIALLLFAFANFLSKKVRGTSVF